jgi:hypothetical protein
MLTRNKLAVVLVLGFAGIASAADPALVALLPPDAKAVAGVNAAQFKGSAFGQFLLSQVSQNEQGFEKLMALTGFDPRRDVQEVLAASTESGPQHGIVAVRGSFDVPRITGLFKAQGGQTEMYGNIEMLKPKPPSSGANAMAEPAIAFLDNSLVIAGNADLVRGAIDRRGGSSVLSADLAAKVAEMSAAQDVWGVSTLPLPSVQTPNPDVNGALQGDLFKSIESTSGGVSFDSGAQVTGEAVTKTEQDAKSLSDALKFLVQLVQMKAPQGPAADLLANLSVTSEANRVKVSFAVTEGQLEQLFQNRHLAKRAAR